LTIVLLEDKTWITLKETTRWLQSWDWNRSFIGLTLWPEEDIDSHFLFSYPRNYVAVFLSLKQVIYWPNFVTRRRYWQPFSVLISKKLCGSIFISLSLTVQF
jgi:hypothetical protein